ncbi:MAG: histidine kinase dimerization/phospho-acceptor domain-containing protein, partial [Solirubrobacteraceae bacterium]
MILASFAVIVGVLTNRQVRTQFDDSQASAVGRLYSELKGNLVYDRSDPLTLDWSKVDVSLTDFAGGEPAQIRIFDNSDGYLLGTQDDISGPGYRAPAPGGLFATAPYRTSGYFVQSGYRVAVKELDVNPSGQVTLLYAVPLSSLNHTINRIDAFLALGVLGGTVMALLAGLFVSARAMRPIRELTDTAREIERTRDPSLSVPHPEAKDEIAQLARTLEGMLAALGAARAETQSMLDRQREFVADASHELRTPLTSVLANLELLNEELTG